MAKIHKITMFIVDASDDFDTTEEILDYFSQDKYCPSFQVVESEQKEFEWDDDVIINYCDTTSEQYQEFFDGIKEKENE